MSIVVLGLSHKTAPISLREQVAFLPTELDRALRTLRQLECIDSGIILSTCNRTEIYAKTIPVLSATASDIQGSLIRWLADFQNLPPSLIESALYFHEQGAAIEQLIQVCSGLDSKIVGEAHILGQVKSAYLQAKLVGPIHAELELLFQGAFSTAKKIRHCTAIARASRSIPAIIQTLMERHLAPIPSKNILLIGAGEMIHHTMSQLGPNEPNSRLWIANRTALNAASFTRYGYASEAITSLPLEAIPSMLPRVDLIITSIARQQALLEFMTVSSLRASCDTAKKPLLIIDLGVPRNVEPQIKMLDNVHLYAIDDLEGSFPSERGERQTALDEARHLVLLGQQRCLERIELHQMSHLFKQFITSIEHFRIEKTREVCQKIASGIPVEEACEIFSKKLTQKLLHQPIQVLRRSHKLSGDSDTIKLLLSALSQRANN